MMEKDKQKVDLTPILTPILLCAIAGLALILRALYFTELSLTPFFRHPVLDSQYYADWARKLAWGGFRFVPDYQGNPLYPYLLALSFRIPGANHYLPRIAQHILGVLTCLLVFRAGKTLFHPVTGLVAAFLYALYMPAVFYEGWLLSASLTAFLTAALLVILLHSLRKPDRGNWLISGLLAGLLMLARPSLIPLAVLVWIVVTFRSGGRSRWVKPFFLFLAGTLLALTPYSLQYYLHQREWVAISPHGGENFYIGNNPQATGAGRIPDFARPLPALQHQDFRREASRLAGRPLSPAQSSRFWFRKGVRFAAFHPGRFFRLFFFKIYLFFSGAEVSDNYHLEFFRSRIPLLKIPFSWRALSTLSLLGLLLSLRSRKDLSLLYLFVASYVSSISLFFVTSRFRLPLAPVLTLPAAYALCFLREEIKGKKRLQTIAYGATGVFIYLILGRPIGGSSACSSHLTAGEVHYRNGDYQQALACFRKAGEELEKQTPGTRHVLSRLLLAQGQTYLATGNPKEAEESFDRLIREEALPPAETYFEMGNAYAAHHLYDTAVEYYRLALQEDPENCRTLNNLGLSLKATGETEEAERSFRRAFEIRPDYAAARANLGNLYLSEGRHEAAINELKAALSMDPGLAQLHLALAFCLQKLNRLSEAEAELQKCPFALRHSRE